MTKSFMENYRQSMKSKVESDETRDGVECDNILYKDVEYVSTALYISECAIQLREYLYSEADVKTILIKIKDFIVTAIKAIGKIIMKILAYLQTHSKDDLKHDIYKHANKSTTAYKGNKMKNSNKTEENKKSLSLYGKVRAQFPDISTDALEIVDSQIFRIVIEKVSYNILLNLKDKIEMRNFDEWKKKTDEASKIIERIMDDADDAILKLSADKHATYNDNLMKVVGVLQGVFAMIVGIIGQINKELVSKSFTSFVFEFLPEGVELDRVGMELFMKVTSIAYSANKNFDQNQVYSILNTDKEKVPEINEMLEHVIDIYTRDLTEKSSSLISYIENKLKSQEFVHLTSGVYNIFGIRAVTYNAMTLLDEEIDLILTLLKRFDKVDFIGDRAAMYVQYGDILTRLKSVDRNANPLYEIIKSFKPILTYEDYVRSLNLDFKFDDFISKKELQLSNNSRDMVHLIHDTMLRLIK